MKAIMAIVLGGACWASCRATQEADLPDQVFSVLQNPRTEFFYSCDNIPPKLLRKAKQVSESTYEFDGVYTLENPNKPFGQYCDSPDTLLNRRLVFIASLNKQHVLCYERGGRAHNLLISYGQLNGRNTSYFNFIIKVPGQDYHNINQIKQAIKDNKLQICYNNGKKVERPTTPF